jgi:hypothetical protein
MQPMTTIKMEIQFPAAAKVAFERLIAEGEDPLFAYHTVMSELYDAREEFIRDLEESQSEPVETYWRDAEREPSWTCEPECDYD